jgi:hypothetical protein
LPPATRALTSRVPPRVRLLFARLREDDAAVADVVLVEYDARMRRVQELGEWNGNDNDRAFLMVGVPAYLLCIQPG